MTSPPILVRRFRRVETAVVVMVPRREVPIPVVHVPITALPGDDIRDG
jgi:hypothetical protein